MKFYWWIYNNSNFFRNIRHFYLYVLKIDWKFQVIALIFSIILIVLMRKKYKARKVTYCQAIACIILPIYVFLLFASLVFSRETLEIRRFNLKIFWTEIAILSGETKYIQTLLQNLLMLMPFGVLFPIVVKEKKNMTLFVGGIISVMLEVLQLVTKTGLCEIDDVIHNTLGVVIGYGVYCVTMMIHKKWRRYYEGRKEVKR